MSKRKDFEITVRTIEIPRDDLIYSCSENVAIYVKNMNKIKDYTQVILEIKELLKMFDG